MTKKLVIVESPAKAKTINKYLGEDFLVKASMGHIRDLPQKQLGVKVEAGFEPTFQIIKGKDKVIEDLKKSASKVKEIYLALDMDREGEAIGWHIKETIGENGYKYHRVLFNEITPRAIKEAFVHPIQLNLHKVYAQHARRILDRLVGYHLSPLLWEKVKRDLSAGRVQSVALRILAEREEEIRAFVSEEYWLIEAIFQLKGSKPFSATLSHIDGKKAKVSTEADAKAILDDLKGASFVVNKIETKEVKRFPLPPFITSTLQQEASWRLNFSPQKTMKLAQQLYEGIDLGKKGPLGLITYMRTDSPRIASVAQKEAFTYIEKQFGPEYKPAKPRYYKEKKGAQGAHEAIRPTSLKNEPAEVRQYLTPDQFKLYTLIWGRFLASQMAEALLEQTTVEIGANPLSKQGAGKYLFKAQGTRTLFDGFMKALQEAPDPEEKALPQLKEGQSLPLKKLNQSQHFTQPPPRFTEASLIKVLEEKGIGRPSTYAPIAQTIQTRGYVHKDKGRLIPSEMGMEVSKLLVANFPDIIDVAFTAQMEEQLDKVEEGQIPWRQLLENFYQPFNETLKKAKKEMKSLKSVTDQFCPKCENPLAIRWDKMGRKFLGCTGKGCKYTESLEGPSSEAQASPYQNVPPKNCPLCAQPMVVKQGRFGPFLGCPNYPECKGTLPLGLGIPCPEPKCDGELIVRRSKKGRIFYGCSKYPKCKFATWQKPVNRPCPSCNFSALFENTVKGKTYLKCIQKECQYSEAAS